MKKLLLLPLLAATFSFTNSKGDLQSDELSPSYAIADSHLDSTLTNNRAVFEITFFAGYSATAKSTIKMSYNGIEKTVLTDANGRTKLNVKPGKYLFKFFYNSTHLEITTDSIEIKPAFQTQLNVYFESSESRVICDKPVIYVYPAQTQAVNVQLDLKGKIGFTYPTYQNGWNFVADPNGTIHMNDKKYDYLFWEGNTDIDNSKVNWSEGFVVTKDSLVSFFEKNLTAMGLNSREIEDYITYWCPRMNANEANYIHFLFNEDYNAYAALHVTPKPDQQFRVFMLWSKADPSIQVKPQTIASFQREGFTVVEWGGAEMDHFPLQKMYFALN